MDNFSAISFSWLEQLMSALYQTNMLSQFIVLTHWNNILLLHMSLQSWYIILILSQPVFTLIPLYWILMKKQKILIW